MNYRSIADLANTIRSNLTKIPRDVDLVVGIPRSGMLAANMIALNRNLTLCDVDAFSGDRLLQHGSTRSTHTPHIQTPSEASHILIVDDSVYSGKTLQGIKNRIKAHHRTQRLTYAAVYSAATSVEPVDISLEVVKPPRVFEWNLMHRPALINWCLDIDGLLCVDPTWQQNDDGDKYIDFLLNASPLSLPTRPVGHLVTSRLEKYRRETETWLRRHGIEYRQLHMIDLPDADTRRRLGCHAEYKAKVYRSLKKTTLFVESEPHQAASISTRSGKPVICFTNQRVYSPDIAYPLIEKKTRHFGKRVANKLIKTLSGSS